MADLITNTEDLTRVANAIRAKAGTEDELVYPEGFVSAIEGIPSGATYTEEPNAGGGKTAIITGAVE